MMGSRRGITRPDFMFKTIPFLTRREFRELLERAEPTPDGCLILRPSSRRDDPRIVHLRGSSFHAIRVVWAETYGDRDLLTHEVIHIAECPHTGGDDGDTYKPICIEATHLRLGLPGRDRLREAAERRTVK